MILEQPLRFSLPLMQGAQVRAAQQALIRAGALNAEADGVYGPNTRDAVRVVQRRMGLPADGVLRAEMLARLLPEAPAALPTMPDWRGVLRPLLPRLATPHGPPVGNGSRRWSLTLAGVLLEGEAAPRRTPGAPRSAAGCWDRYRAAFEAAAQRFQVPVELLLATACTESGGRADAVREEPGYLDDRRTPERVSPGLMQTLLSTAREALGHPSLDRLRLLEPATSIAAGAALIRRQALRGTQPTGFDPPLVAIAYNAGALRPLNEPDPWGLVQTRRGGTEWHAEAFIAYFGDVLAVLAEAPPAAETPAFSAIR